MSYLFLIFISLNSWALTNAPQDNLNILREEVTKSYQNHYQQSFSKDKIIAELKIFYPKSDHADIDLFAQELPSQITIPFVANKNTLSLELNKKIQINIKIESVFYSKIKFNNYPLELKPYKTFKDQLKYLQRVVSQRSHQQTAQLNTNKIPWSWLWEAKAWAEQCSWIQSIADRFGFSQCQKNQVLAALFEIINETGIPEHCSRVATTKSGQERLITCIFNTSPNLTQMYLNLRSTLIKEKLEVNITCKEDSKSEITKRNKESVTALEIKKINNAGGDCCSYKDEKEKAACIEIINQFDRNRTIKTHIQEVVNPKQGGTS